MKKETERDRFKESLYMRPQDRQDFFRFYWTKDDDPNNPILMYREKMGDVVSPLENWVPHKATTFDNNFKVSTK